MAWTEAARQKARDTKALSAHSNQYAKAKALGKIIEVSEETRQKVRESSLGRKHSPETKQLLSDLGRASSHRRLVRSIRPYITKSGEIIQLDSSWEEFLAKRLDELNVEWERPSTPLKWIDSQGKSRNYFPDFWLPSFSVFLDPKNSAAMTAQAEKVQWLKTNRDDIVFLETEESCKRFNPSVCGEREITGAF